MALLKRRWSRLDVFILGTVACAVAVLVHAVPAVSPVPRGARLALVIALIIGVLLGELFPIEIVRNGRRSDEVTVSTTLALALVLIAPLGWALCAQAIPLVADDIRRRKHWSRPLFNVGQYSLTFAATNTVFCSLGQSPTPADRIFASSDLPAIFAAAGTYFLVNQLLVGIAVALWTGENFFRQLRADGVFQLGTSGLLVCLAPVVIAVAQFSIFLTPLLVLPLAAVRTSARMAVQRQHDALHDALTGLPNRAFLREELERRTTRHGIPGRGVPQGLAVLLLDLDHFKEINDTLGHLAGDELIREVARRLLEATTSRGDEAVAGVPGSSIMVSRLGGDEFAVITQLQGVEEAWTKQVAELAETISRELGHTVVLADVRLAVEASIGVAVAPWHGTAVDDLMAKADVAMYTAKKQRDGWAMYDAGQDSNSPERLALLSELRDGIEQGQLKVVYQPKCHADDRRLHSVEALVRWQHPVRGLLTPNNFIDVAESTGIIAPLTLVVLDEAVRQARVWLDAGRCIPVAVNLSARLLTDLELPLTVEHILRTHGLPAELLTLEVTESTIMNDPTRAGVICARLRALGVRLAIDDYGAGYSSLSYLCNLEANELKIDKSFVAKLATNGPQERFEMSRGEQAIVRSTIELGRSLGMTVVAEGVEDEDVWRLLTALNCDLIQGYALTPPLLAGAFEMWLANWEEGLRGADAQNTQPAHASEVPSC